MIAVVFDLDGVLYRGPEPIPEAAGCIRRLRDTGTRLGFLTNNSTRERSEYVEILARHNIHAEEREIMTSGEATARFLRTQGIQGGRIFVIGGEGLQKTLSKAGYVVETGDDGDRCELVVIGWDRSFSFAKIVRAQKEVLENGARLIATNVDAMFPAQGGRLLPGAGAMVASVEASTGRKAEVIGKPNTISLRFLLEELGVWPGTPVESIWCIGDRLDTDIACGNAFGARTVLVTTGITDRASALAGRDEMKPDHVIDSLRELPGLILKESAHTGS